MDSTPPPHPGSRRWSGVRPGLAVLAAGAAAFLFGSYLPSRVGRGGEDARRLFTDYRGTGDELWTSLTMDYIANSAESNGIVVFGDSTARSDIDCAALGDRLGEKAFDIGGIAPMGWPGFSYMLERYLEHHPKPRVIVLGIYPHTLAERFSRGDYYRNRLVWCYGGGGEETRPPHAEPYRHYMSEGVLTLLAMARSAATGKGKDALAGGLDAGELTRGWTEHRGSMILIGKRAQQPDPERLDSVEITPNTLDFLNATAARTREKGIFLAVRMMPFRRGLGGLSADVFERLKAFERNFDNVAILGSENWELDPPYFFDEVHLNAEGAAVVTARLADELDAVLKSRGIKLGNR